MKKTLLLAAATWCVVASATFAHVISVDSGSTNALSKGAYAADLLTPGPTRHVTYASLMLQTGDDLDALSAGEDAFTPTPILFFSVDRSSTGINGGAFIPYVSDVYAEALAGQQAGDVYATSYGHPGVPVWSSPVGQNMLHINQSSLGLYPALFPTQTHAGGTIDDLDALCFTEFDLTGDGAIDRNVYFSLDAGSPTLTATMTADDILMLAPGANAITVFADGLTNMGLITADDLDALVLLDLVNPGVLDPGVDMALFSLAPGSPTLTVLNLSAADIFLTTFSGSSSVAYTHTQLGLLFEDNVDALETQPGTQVPEPATLLLLGTGLLAAAGIRRRRSI